MIDWAHITKRFLLGESVVKPSIDSRLQTLTELLGNIKPKTQSDERRIQSAIDQVQEIKKSYKKLLESHNEALEKLKLFENEKP